MRSDQDAWDSHWKRTAHRPSLFGTVASAVRRLLLARVMRRLTDTHFARRGVFVEAGCGSGESAARISRDGRLLVGLDFSLAALVTAGSGGTYRARVCGDVFALPFADGSLDGIWNLGVMEHFAPPAAARILAEFHRALRPGGTVILLWPPTFGLSRWVLLPLELARSVWRRSRFRFFPDEVNRLPSAAAGRHALADAGLEPRLASFSPADGFNHLMLVGRRR